MQSLDALHPIEKAQQFLQLYKLKDFSIEQLALKTKYSARYIYKILKLNELDENCKKTLLQHKASMRVCLDVLAIQKKENIKAAERLLVAKLKKDENELYYENTRGFGLNRIKVEYDSKLQEEDVELLYQSIRKFFKKADIPLIISRTNGA